MTDNHPVNENKQPVVHETGRESFVKILKAKLEVKAKEAKLEEKEYGVEP
jgi:hypothetical protein